MKKLIIVLCCVMALFMCLSIPCLAAEPEEVVDTTAPDITEASPAEEETHTIFTRIWEFCKENEAKLLTLLGDAVLVILAIYMRLKSGKNKKEVAAALSLIQKETGLSLSNQGNVVEVVNNLIDSYNVQSAEYAKLRESYEKYGATELDRNRVIGALAAEISAVLDILSTVYVNNKNLPQGVKDLVNIKYANCLKALENDEALASIVKAVRAVLGGSEEAGSSEVKVVPEDTEV